MNKGERGKSEKNSKCLFLVLVTYRPQSGQNELILMGKNYLFHKRRKSDRCLGIGQSYLREARAGMEIVCSLLYEVRKQKHPNWTLTSHSPMESTHEVRRHLPVQRSSK